MVLLADIWMPDLATLRLILPELTLIAAVAAILAGSVMLGRSTRIVAGIAVVGCLAAATAAVMSLDLVGAAGVELFGVAKSEHGGHPPSAVPGSAGASPSPSARAPAQAALEDGLRVSPGMLAADRLGMVFRILLLLFLVAILGMWLMFDAPREGASPEFLTLLLCSALGMSLMTTCTNLLLMIIAIELASQPSYVLAGFDRLRRAAGEAGLKYVLFGAATTGFMIFGTSLLFGLYGTLHIPTLIERVAATPPAGHGMLLAFALLAVFAGIGFKIAAVPFHFWCPDVFQGASLPVATWLSVASKAAGVVLLVRAVQLFAAPADAVYAATALPILQYGAAFFGVLTCTVANLVAYGQTNVRRLLAYSSIAHAGYMLCAAAIVLPAAAVSSAAVSAVVAYVIVYMFMNFGAFLSLGLVSADKDSEELDAFTGLGWRDPPVAASLTICLVSLIGLPPLGGFIVKWWLIYALGSAAAATPVLWVVAGAVVINTAISLYYYTRVIRQMYLRGIGAAGGLRAPLLGKAALHGCALALLLTGTLLVPALKQSADFAAQAMYAAAPRPTPVAAR